MIYAVVNLKFIVSPEKTLQEPILLIQVTFSAIQARAPFHYAHTPF